MQPGVRLSAESKGNLKSRSHDEMMCLLFEAGHSLAVFPWIFSSGTTKRLSVSRITFDSLCWYQRLDGREDQHREKQRPLTKKVSTKRC